MFFIYRHGYNLVWYWFSGLEKDGEFSYENLVFKFLRRNGYIDKLFNFKNKLMDKNLSIENTDVE